MLTKRLGHMKAVASPQHLSLLQQLGCSYSTKKQQQDVQHQQKPQQQELQSQQQESKEPLERGDADENGAISEVEWLTQELAAVKVEHGDLLEKYKRALADGENMRKRLNKQIDEAKIFGIQGFCKDLIEVADVLGHATQSVPKEKLSSNGDLRNLYEGLSLTRASLLQVFKRHGLETLDPINQKFDPNLHEALFQTEDDSVEANTVVQVTKLGYKLHKRCIRPALVGVSKR
ncbi:grpE protein homolog, mitochondrial-like [Drosophila innubila]|uniref:grpE protein homolog, mitochondrial-like n=1 Tax=Drosophila innubila TaxID=198719 RepID=UPI00148C39A7|nr:grpE protein homolog, mitochondrial-like [Drosophila innubila]